MLPNGHRHKARADALACVERSLRLCNGGNAVHCSAHDDADTVAFALDGQLTVLESLLGRNKGKLHERVHRAGQRFRHVGSGIEVLQLCRDLHGSSDASKRVIFPTPHCPSTSADQYASTPIPIGVTAPIPVMTNFCSFMLVPLLTEIYAKACPIVIRQIYNMHYLIAL